MQTHSPAGGGCAGHGGGLSPSDPPALFLLCLGGSGVTWGTQGHLAQEWLLSWWVMMCSQVLQSQCSPQKEDERRSYSQITYLVYIKLTHFLNSQQLEGLIALDEAEKAPACDGF